MSGRYTESPYTDVPVAAAGALVHPVNVVLVFPVYVTTVVPIWNVPADSKSAVETTVIVEAPAEIAPLRVVVGANGS